MKRDLFATAMNYFRLLSNTEPEQKICSPSKHVNTKNTNGFTLAEVLITLGIIGVVAAITLPVILSNIQKRDTVTRLKKAYSTLSNAINRVKAEEGGELFEYGYDNLHESVKNIAQYMNKVSYDDTNNTTLFNDIERYYPNSHIANYNEQGEHIGMPDGSEFYFMFYCGGYLGGIYVDVNGKNKKPNKDGIDVFAFYYSDKQEKVGNTWVTTAKVLEPSKESTSTPCNSLHIGTHCTAKVLQEGKMDYLK